MSENLATENAYLSVSDFPIVVLTESGVLSDLERTSVMERLEDLLDQAERHALVLDLTEAGPLPDKQRIYIAEAFQMRSKAIAQKWAALAVVVSGPEHLRMSKAEFWIGICPAPGRVFSALEAATEWAQECLVPGSTQQQPTPAPVATPRTSRTGAITRPTEATPRRSAITTPDGIAARTSVPSPKGKQAASPARSHKLGRRAWMIATVLGLAALLLVFGPSGDGSLSSAEAKAFEELKSSVSMEVFLESAKERTPLSAGAKCAPGDKLGFGVGIPAKGHIMILGVRADASTFPVFPGARSSSVSKSDVGARLPISYPLDSTMGKQSLHLVYCPMRFKPSDCDASPNGGLACPSECVTSSLAIEKAAAGT